MSSSTLYLSLLFILSIGMAFSFGDKHKGFRYHLLFFSLSIITMILNEYLETKAVLYVGIALWITSFFPLFLIRRKISSEIVIPRERNEDEGKNTNEN